jgi:hypothetical protein
MDRLEWWEWSGVSVAFFANFEGRARGQTDSLAADSLQQMCEFIFS